MNKEKVEPMVVDKNGNIYFSAIEYHKDIDALQQKIDKAIEYIKTHSEMTDLQICGIENVLAFRGSATKLLEILGDKE